MADDEYIRVKKKDLRKLLDLIEKVERTLNREAA